MKNNEFMKEWILKIEFKEWNLKMELRMEFKEWMNF